jgi:hypothetical protein
MKDFSDRVRFNWGFWDGVADREAGRQPMWKAPHFDRVYGEGYEAGRSLLPGFPSPETSDAAWKALREEKKAASVQRRALREMRPSNREVRL